MGGNGECTDNLECENAMKHMEFTSERTIESYGLLDLYSYSAFLKALDTPRIYDAFAAFLRSEYSTEHLEFWSRCKRYRTMNREMIKAVSTLRNLHLKDGSCEEINVSQRAKSEGQENATQTMQELEESQDIFGDLQREVEMLLWRDPYPRFLKHHLAYNASKSLEWDPTRKASSFKGLGDCFCLTDPSKHDNPIVLCSDAFVQVTGYSTAEIFRNCRFLQGSLSDPRTVTRIGEAIKQGRESTEVILNYRRDGTPFWNLLLVAPLRSSTGEITYFFGAQVDVSSLFQRNNDLSALLSRDFALPSQFPCLMEGTPETRKSFFRRLSEKTKLERPKLRSSPMLTPLEHPILCLEEEVVREDIQTIGEQMDVFKSAYAKYIIVQKETGIPLFYSEAASKYFFPVFQDKSIFAVLLTAFTNVDLRSLKKLQKAFAGGVPRCIRLTRSQPGTPLLGTPVEEGQGDGYFRSRMSKGDSSGSDRSFVMDGGKKAMELMAIHMTPLKDERGKVEMFVFVLATTAEN